MLDPSQSWWRRPAGGKEVWNLALPLVISSLSWTVMGFTDRMFLMWHSEAAMAAAMPSLALWWVVLCIPLGVCMYVNTFVSQYHGAGRLERIGPAAWQGVWLGLAASPLVFLTLPLAEQIFNANAPSPEVARDELIYYWTMCWCAPAMLVSNAMAAFFTGRGRTGTVMIVDAISAGANVVLDYLWIFGYAGFPEMGIAGAGWATAVAHVLRVTILAWLFLRKNERETHATARGWRFDKELFLRLTRYGVPSGVQMMLEVAGFTVFIHAMGSFGILEQTATNLTFNVSMVAFMPIFGLSTAAGIMVGRYLGEDRPDLAARGTWTTCTLSLVYMAFMSVFYLLLPEVFLFGYLKNADTTDPERLKHVTIVLLRFVAAYNAFDAINMVFAGAIKGAGDTRFVMIVSLIMSIILAGGVYVCIEHLGLGLFGSWTFITIWLYMLGTIYFLRFLQGKWRSMRVIEPDLGVVTGGPPLTGIELGHELARPVEAEVEWTTR